MTFERMPHNALAAETIGQCESCSKPIREGDQFAICADGCCLCYDHAPMLSEVVAQMDEALAIGEADEWFHRDEATLREERATILAAIEANGDRKAVTK